MGFKSRPSTRRFLRDLRRADKYARENPKQGPSFIDRNPLTTGMLGLFILLPPRMLSGAAQKEKTE